jgi:hypothetical protein
MSSKSTVYPSEIIAAIKRHRSKKDPKGDGAFQVDTNIRDLDTMAFTTFKIAKLNNGKEEYIPLKIFFKNMDTRAKIKAYEDRKFGLQIQFRKSSSFERPVRDPNTKKITKTIKEDYGKAKLLTIAAFKRIMTEHLKAKRIYRKKQDFTSSGIQAGRTDKKGNYEAFDDPLIRVNLKYEKDKDAQKPKITSMPAIDIYDVNNVKDPRPKAGIPFKLAKNSVDRDDNPIDVSAGGIDKYLTVRSKVSGVENLSSVTMTGQGIGLPGSFEFLIVKPSKGFTTEPNEVYDGEDYQDMEDTKVIDVESGEESDDDSEPKKKGDDDEFKDETEELDEELDDL